MDSQEHRDIDPQRLVQALSDPGSYRDPSVGPGERVVVHETHISWVFLVGDNAFKVKKPIQTEFLDYSTLELRHRYCQEEVRLNQRYAPRLYLGVVPIVLHEGRLQVAGPGQPVEYAVNMRRFPDQALLSQQLAAGRIGAEQVARLAATVAEFHQQAEPLTPDQPWSDPALIAKAAQDNLEALRDVGRQQQETLLRLRGWTTEFYAAHQVEFQQRLLHGFVRECHGDLHLQNIVYWDGEWTLFDGIEFNPSFHWIDVLSDAAFAAMDFAAHHRFDLCYAFVNDYLEQTGDHQSPSLLRWYLVYRALTRAKVALIRAGQDKSLETAARAECYEHIELASRFSQPRNPVLWITHGVSGSGKTTRSRRLVETAGAIRLRSDIERKRHFGLRPTDRVSETLRERVYSGSATEVTYQILRRKALGFLRAGYSVVVDATFLQRAQRQQFQQLAESESAGFAILDCEADRQELRRRLVERQAHAQDASDADVAVLQQQLANREPLDAWERRQVVTEEGLTAESGRSDQGDSPP